MNEAEEQYDFSEQVKKKQASAVTWAESEACEIFRSMNLLN